MGDLYIDQLSDSKDHKSLQNIIHSFDFLSLISEPTRIDIRRGFHSKKAIDYVITNLNDKIKCNVIEPHISDHKGQLVIVKELSEFKTNEKAEISILRRHFSEQNMRNFMHAFSPNCDLFTENYGNINSYYDEFLVLFEWCLNVTCPKENTQIKTNKERKNPRIDKEIDKINFLYYVAKNSHDADLMASYKSYKKSINKKIANIKIEENTQKIRESDNKNKAMWTIVNERLGRKNVRKEIKLKINDEIITDQKVICDSFITHFATTVSKKLDIHFGGDLYVH
ncbi:hypothetical protein JTB14_004944 [Gonioctena quinquepunctata]|nr:hypothetical protein JTB14_004944 [Gonioctena quinquepunctata]